MDFARLDLTCGSPVGMLEVHAPLSGDISDKLGRHTFAANLKYTLNFLDKWGGEELSKLEVEVLERGLEAFGCERPAAPYQEEMAFCPLQVHRLGKVAHKARRPGQLEIAHPPRQVLGMPAAGL